jgi:hypothetical protein
VVGDVGGAVVVAPGVVVVALGVVVAVGVVPGVVVAPGVVVVALGLVVVVVLGTVVVVGVTGGGLGVSTTLQPAFQIARPALFQFSPWKPIEGTGGMMSPHMPLGELGGSVFGKTGPVWLAWPAMSIEFADTVIWV